MTFKEFFAIIVDKSKKVFSRPETPNAETLDQNGDPSRRQATKDANTESVTPTQSEQTTGIILPTNAADIAGSANEVRNTLNKLGSQLAQLETQLRDLSPQINSTPQTNTSPWALPAPQAIFLLLFALTVGVILYLDLFQLDTLQSEVYGDINIVLDFVKQILNGGWPYKFNLSAGPLYFYLITPIIYVTGLNYLGLKIASVIISLIGLAATYAFSRKLVNDYFALLVVFIAGVSSWLLIWSRIGNPQIVLPLLTMLCLWLVIRIVQFGHQRDVIACAFISSFGWYIFPQSFIMPGVIFLTLLCLRWAGHSLPRGWAINFIIVCLICMLPFAKIVASDLNNFTNGYVGGKLQPDGDNNALSVLGGNIVNAALAFNVRGDETGRSNPETLPHLDWVSGILFLAGMVFWLTSREKRRWLALWLVPLLLLQVPSILVINQPHEVPSASRTMAVVPIVYMLVASGLWWLAQFLRTRGKSWLAILVTCLLLSSILYLNVQRYFQSYLNGLPYHNTPIERVIADYANLLPPETQVYMIGCCWEEQKVPDYFVQYDMIHPENLHYMDPGSLSCAQLQSITTPAVFIWSFHNELAGPQLEACKQWLPAQLYSYRGWSAFNAAPLRLDFSLPPTSNQDPPQIFLEQSQVLLDGQTTDVEYSTLDLGSITDLFDGNTETLIRGKSANPMVVVLHFSQPRTLSNIELTVGSMHHFHVIAIITYADNRSDSVENDYEGLPDDPHITISLPEYPQLITSLRLMVQDMNPPDGDAYHMHIRELQVH